MTREFVVEEGPCVHLCLWPRDLFDAAERYVEFRIRRHTHARSPVVPVRAECEIRLSTIVYVRNGIIHDALGRRRRRDGVRESGIVVLARETRTPSVEGAGGS